MTVGLEYPFELPAILFRALGMPPDSQIDDVTLEMFGRAVMVIGGSDGRMSVWERGWLTTYLSTYGASEAVCKAVEDYEYHNVELEVAVAPVLRGNFQQWGRRALLEAAIRVCQADGLSDAEHAAILRTGALIGFNANQVEEVRSLLNLFDRATLAVGEILDRAQQLDADLYGESGSPTGWEDAPPHMMNMSRDQQIRINLELFAHGVLYVATADNSLSEVEKTFFSAYLRHWGATPQQIQALTSVQHSALNPKKLLQNMGLPHWSLVALTSAALHVAGADAISAPEAAALEEIHEIAGQDGLLLTALKGLESVRSSALKRLDAIFA
ncbi:MAG: TerB family tellurite resistance protein [Phototrophicaceae bacterium]|jgi:uncharacterized tellurite resistance protein B-like protein